MANDKDYGSQSREQGNRPGRDKNQGQNERDPSDERDGERDLGSRDRGVERSDWNYSKPGTEKEEKADDLESDDDMADR